MTSFITLKGINGKVNFTEELIFDFKFDNNFSRAAFDNAAFGLFVMAGISYFKSALPSKLIFRKGGLSEGQITFFQKTYLNGLGEFFYNNNIDPSGKINFDVTANATHAKPASINGSTGRLVAVGGGKDSLTTIEILNKMEKPFSTFIVNSDKRFDSQLQKVFFDNKFEVHRKISPVLMELNRKGALNGHIPISSIISFIGVAVAILGGKKDVIFSNENSANEPTCNFHGMDINHQYAKTLDFERDFPSHFT